jgi:spore coat polysaccharide biosynthesis protein SpsF (cytidylyltransferase family)
MAPTMILGILQARMSSTRLPGKVMQPLLGRPMIARQLERLARCGRVDRFVIATSVEPSDDVIAEQCAALGIDCRRGPLSDVLGRFMIAAEPYLPDHVVRLTADCPLVDWEVVDDLVALHVDGGYDFSTNAIHRTYQHGLDCEIASYDTLKAAATEAKDPYDREHVMPFIYAPNQRFRIGHLVRSDEDLSFMRWTVDHPDDYALIKAIYEELYPNNPAFTSRDVVALLGSRRDLRFLNASVQDAAAAQRSRQYWAAFDSQSQRSGAMA